MEASKFLPEGDPYTPDVVVLVEAVEDKEPIYHFFVDGGPIEDVGVTREFHAEGLVTYNFHNDFKQFAAADILVGGDMIRLEWSGPEGVNPPQKYAEFIPFFVDAAVYADYGVVPFRED